MGNEQSGGTNPNAPTTPKSNKREIAMRVIFYKNFLFCIAPVYHPNITVVNSGPISASGAGATSSSSVLDDGDLNKLAAIPKFLPIIRSSINQQNDPTQIPHLENGPVRPITFYKSR